MFDETDGGPSSPGYDVVDSGRGVRATVSPASYIVDEEGFGMKHIGVEIREILMDRGEKRQAGIGLVGRLFNRKYRKSRAEKVEARMADIEMHR